MEDEGFLVPPRDLDESGAPRTPAGGDRRSRDRRRSILFTCAVVVFFILLALLFTRPLIAEAQRSAVKHISDPPFQAWSMAWELHTLGRNPADLFNANIFYPNRYTLAYSDHQIVNTILAAPLMLVTGNPMQAANYLLIIQFFLCSLGAYCLVVRLTRSRLAGIFAGVAYSYAPYKLAHMPHLNLCSAAWIPFAFLFLHRYTEERKVRDAFLFALFFTLQFLTTWHYGIILSVGVLLFLVVRLIWKRKTYTLKWSLVLVTALACAGLVLLPFALPYFRLQKENPRFQRDIKEVETFTADVEDFLAAPADSLVWGKATAFARDNILARGEPAGPDERAIFPGLIPLVFGLAGAVWLGRKGKGEERFSFWFYTSLLVVSAWLCLGYPLYFFGHRLKIPTLYQLLYYVFPGFKAMRVPPRFDILVALSLAVLGGFALKGLVGWLSRKKGAGVAGVAAVAVLALLVVDLMSAGIPTREVPAKADFPPVYSWLAEQKGDSPTVELPILIETNGRRWVEQDSMRTYYSTEHFKKLVNGYSGFLPDSIYDAARATKDFPSREAVDYLRKQKVRYIIVHGQDYEPYDPVVVEKTLAWAKAHPGELRFVRRFGDDYVFEVGRGAR